MNDIIINKHFSEHTKIYCVLGVLLSDEGISIKNEMLEWLIPEYDVITVEQKLPGELYEYPAIKYAVNLSKETNEICLYLHTKGAAHKNTSQQYVRKMWKDEFINHINEYLHIVKTNIPTIACPFTGIQKITWLNGMIFNSSAAKIIEIPLPKKRCYYEQLCRKTVSEHNYNNINVVGRIYNDIDPGETEDEKTLSKKKASKYFKNFIS